jgi:hypothetical protein
MPREVRHPSDTTRPTRSEEPTMTTTTATRPAPTAPAAVPTGARVDLYAPIHKALRLFMTDTLHRVGRIDVADAGDMARTLGQLDALLDECLHHIERENEYMHAAMEARQPRGASRTADDHLEHWESIDALRTEANGLRAAAEGERHAIALRLYRHLALFVAENFQHMHVEETHNNGVMWAHYSDAEIVALHHRLLASIPPAETLQVARWMVPALTPSERAMVLGDMKAGAPAPFFQAVLETIRPHLDDTAWNQLARAVGLPQQPGLVDYI